MIGALAWSSSIVIGPDEVSSTTTGLSAGAAPASAIGRFSSPDQRNRAQTKVEHRSSLSHGVRILKHGMDIGRKTPRDLESAT